MEGYIEKKEKQHKKKIFFLMLKNFQLEKQKFSFQRMFNATKRLKVVIERTNGDKMTV